MKFKTYFLAAHLSLGLFSCQSREKTGENLKEPKSCADFITLGPTITELTVALKANSRLLAVSRYDDLPEVADKPRVGGIFDPEIERITALNPACLFYIPSGAGLEMRLTPLRKAGQIRVIPIDIPNIDAIPGALSKLGKLLNLQDNALLLRENFKSTQQALKTSAAKKEKKLRAVTVYGLMPLVVAGRGSMGHELMTLAGLENPIEKESYPVIDEEYFISLKPDLVFDLSHQEGGERLKRLLSPNTRLITLNAEELRHPSLNSLSVWQKELKELGL